MFFRGVRVVANVLEHPPRLGAHLRESAMNLRAHIVPGLADSGGVNAELDRTFPHARARLQVVTEQPDSFLEKIT